MLCLSAARNETVELLRESLGSTKPPTDAALVLGGAGVTRGSRESFERLTPPESSTSPSGGCGASRPDEPLAEGRPRGRGGCWGLGARGADRPKLFRFSYSDIALLGKLVTRGPHWRAVGWVVHIVNGAVAGLVFWALYEWIGGNAFRFAIGFAMVEHLVTYPLTTIVDRGHPARGAPELPPMSRSGPGVRPGDVPPPALRCRPGRARVDLKIPDRGGMPTQE